MEPRGPSVCGLDVGTGASCIYSLLGTREYGWSFIASDIDETALTNAEKLLNENGLKERITLRQQQDPRRALRGILLPHEVVAFSICNPPFHETIEHARQAASSKWKRLGKELKRKNYQGQEPELCCEGGEVGFVTRLMEESAKVRFRSRCLWYSSLLSRHSSLQPIFERLGELGAKRRRFELQQGRNVKWVVAWSFFPRTERRKRLEEMLQTGRDGPNEVSAARAEGPRRPRAKTKVTKKSRKKGVTGYGLPEDLAWSRKRGSKESTRFG
ncbi:unnamed protein product [Durusdinium trenchii]